MMRNFALGTSKAGGRGELPCQPRLLVLLVYVLAVWCPILRTSAAPKGQAEHVVVIVWDGMRPDFVSQQHTPAFYALAQQGTWFKQHHAVYVSTTEVNGTALNTGMYPEHSGIAANIAYLPEIDKSGPVATEDMNTVRRADLVTHGHYLPVPTLAEILQQNHFPTAICCTKSVALLFDRSEDRTSEAARSSVDFYN